MPLTKKEKEQLGKGAIIGGILGACIGAPGVGAIAGGIINYNKDKNVSKMRKP